MRDLKNDKNEMPGTAMIRRDRVVRRLRFDAGDRILFDVEGFRRDRTAGLAEYASVENNISIRPAWPEFIYET